MVGPDATRAWADAETSGPFDGANGTNVRSAVKKYIRFSSQLSPVDAEVLFVESEVANDQATISVFRYEQELQVSVRRQIASVEAGLIIADGGAEKSVPTGRIDVLAKDSNGSFVVIELKVGLCPKGAIEQVLGYVTDIEAEDSTNRCRAILIAGEFSDRMLGAAKKIGDLTLMTYGVSLTFETAN